MVAIGIAGASLAAGGPPSIASDQEQYTAGQTVQLTGQNWQAGEAVHVVVDDAGGDPWTHAADLTGAADGTVADSFVLPETVTGAFTVMATAPSGSATTTFTVSAPPPPQAAPTISSDKGNYLPGRGRPAYGRQLDARLDRPRRRRRRQERSVESHGRRNRGGGPDDRRFVPAPDGARRQLHGHRDRRTRSNGRRDVHGRARRPADDRQQQVVLPAR